MSARLIVESAGPGATIQDAGRFGLLRYGVTPAGPMDWMAMQTANRALGNASDAAAVEIGTGGITLRVEEPSVVSFAGGGFRWTLGAVMLPAAARILLRPNETLHARSGPWGAFAYCALPGGLDVAPVMGSRATHVRSKLGGIDGRWLQAGDALTSAAASDLDDAALDHSWLRRSDTPIRVVLGPQDDHFHGEAVRGFLDGLYTLSAQADRMAYKLQGPKLAHARDYNIVSDGVALGAIQVAGDGQPMVLMADRQPTGGYPKIAHVCRADIGRFAQLRPGDTCRFHAITPAEARTALADAELALTETGRNLRPLRLMPSRERLLSENLISGISG